MGMPRSLRFVFAPLLLAACAAPAQPSNNSGTERGPGVDLGGFVAPQDLASSSDLARLPSGDMASAPGDMASAPGDMAMASSSCGSITVSGICVGTILKTCDPFTNTLTTTDCTTTGALGCEVLLGLANCFF
jgi:hypothetical protein